MWMQVAARARGSRGSENQNAGPSDIEEGHACRYWLVEHLNDPSMVSFDSLAVKAISRSRFALFEQEFQCFINV